MTETLLLDSLLNSKIIFKKYSTFSVLVQWSVKTGCFESEVLTNKPVCVFLALSSSYVRILFTILQKNEKTHQTLFKLYESKKFHRNLTVQVVPSIK